MEIISSLEDRETIYKRLLHDNDFIKNLSDAGKLLTASVRSGKAVLVCGNGGSAAESMHMSAELVGRFRTNRTALPSISLVSDTASLTAVANDFGYKEIFARQVEAYHDFSGAVVLLSTSGNSENLLAAAKQAKKYGLSTISILGKDGGQLKNFCDIVLLVPSFDTPIIQEVHLALIHMLCGMIEDGYH